MSRSDPARLSRRQALAGLSASALLAVAPRGSLLGAAALQGRWLPASHQKLPRWRGFNLLEKFQLPMGRKPFVEKDFQLIAKLGFNFVRLPMDYRFWIKDGNWEQFDEATLKDIDQAVEWGNQYGVHVCINFHRAPGYTVARPPEKTDLFKDPETQRVCCLHWGTFARRYKGIPSERVSFNLMNEPAGVESKVYAAVALKLLEAIHKEDPNRLVISDGLQWGQQPCMELKGHPIAQATRGYSPSEISHYKASWVGRTDWPDPQWPRLMGVAGPLMSPRKPEVAGPVVIDGPFAKETELRVLVHKVSQSANLVVEADGAKIFEHAFKPGPGEGEWKKVEFVEKYKLYQNIYDKSYTAKVPAGTKRVTIRLTDGDWLQPSELGLKPAGGEETVVPFENAWGKKPAPFRFAPDDPKGPIIGLPMKDRAWLWKSNIEPWQKAQEAGIGVMVGEWGAFNKTPHDVVLRWAEDSLANWQQAGWGWAMWNFRGSFGVLDSGRADVKYEEYEGHKLDRKLLDLLLKY